MNIWNRDSLSYHDMQRIMQRLVETVEIFSGFTQAELVDLLGCAEKCTFEAGKNILSEGSTGNFMYIIIDGAVEIRKKLAGGGHKTLCQLRAGNCFGEMSLVDNDVRSASVKAVEKCLLLRIGEGDFWKNPTMSAKLYRNISRLLSHRLRDTNAMISFAYLEPSEDSCPEFDPAITQRKYLKS
ncbi:MAG: cyclic nucleotide-binding domain-containing protein [Sulfuricella sp.]|nr:cyclic nucleotide-binding domain-containing protein [Sulfuricella sp.]